jgi:hypothetical protein
VPAVTSAADVHFSANDVLLLCVKSQDTAHALVEIRGACPFCAARTVSATSPRRSATSPASMACWSWCQACSSSPGA